MCSDTPPFQSFVVDEKSKFIKIEQGLDFFTPAEKLYLMKKELDGLRAEKGEDIIPGHNSATLYPGKSIIRRMISHNLISSIQPIHDREQLDKEMIQKFVSKIQSKKFSYTVVSLYKEKPLLLL